MVNVVAVCLAGGEVKLVNLLYDEVLFTYRVRASSATFLTFEGLEKSLMATASDQAVTLWDLNQHKIWHEFKPHQGRSITWVEFLPGEPVLFTASEEDNSIKMWLFERGQSEPRLLR